MASRSNLATTKEDNFVYEKPRNIFTLINEANRKNAEVMTYIFNGDV
jgi:hypothetical protein